MIGGYDVSIDDTFVRIGGKAYAIDKISSVEVRQAPAKSLAVAGLAAVVAIALYYAEQPGGAFGLAVIAAALGFLALRPHHRLILVTTGGEQEALESRDEDQMQEVGRAIEQAIARR